MSYILAFTATLMFSLVGTLVKVASPYVPASAVTFSRFFFGALFLLAIAPVMKHKTKWIFTNKWIWIAAGAKLINYFCENTALHSGVSFGNIVVYPCQGVALCLFSVIFFHEKLGPRKVFSTLLCIAGILIISWNGSSMDIFVADSLPITLLFVAAAFGAAGFVLAQKQLVQEIAPADMNLSVFSVSALIAAFPMGFQYQEFKEFRIEVLLALIGLGLITGGAFLLLAKSLKKMSPVVNGMIQNSASIFALLWARIFWNESITSYVLVGTVIFIVGLVFLNVSPKKGIFVN